MATPLIRAREPQWIMSILRPQLNGMTDRRVRKDTAKIATESARQGVLTLKNNISVK